MDLQDRESIRAVVGLMPTLIKGVVIERRLGLSRIKLKSGRRFWTKAPKGIGIRDMVYVAWDYTRDRPSKILTSKQVENTPTEVGDEEPKLEDFSNPEDEKIEARSSELEVEVREFLEPDGCGDIEVEEVETP